MMNEMLNDIIRSFESENQLLTGQNKLGGEIDLINVTTQDFEMLADDLSAVLPEELKPSVNTINNSLKELTDPGLSPAQKNELQIRISELFRDHNAAVVYMNFFNRILIANEYDPVLFEQLNHSYNFPVHQGPVIPFRNRYIAEQAEAYARGNMNDTISYLLKSENKVFTENLVYDRELKTAITLIEREQLKKKMEVLDETDDFDLPESEMKAAITQSERQRLKGILKNLDAEDEMEKTTPSAKIVSIEKQGFNWKRFAIAAGLVGVIAITAVVVLNRKEQSGLAGTKPGTADTTKGVTPQQQNDLLANNSPDTIELNLSVKRETALGFAEKKETIIVHVYKAKKNIPDSLAAVFQNLDQQYIFHGDTLSVYLAEDSALVVYTIEREYYMKIGDTVYRIRRSDKFSMPEKISDKDILERINKINFQQGN